MKICIPLIPFVSSKDILHMNLEQINLCARRDKDNQEFRLDEVQVLNFFGIIILIGYHCMPSEADYWYVISRNYFQTTKKYIHLIDNTYLEENNKTIKVAPLHMYKKLNEALPQFGSNKSSSIDESLIPYFGRRSLKMFIKGEHNRLGYKLWIIARTVRCPYMLDIYQEKIHNDNTSKKLLRQKEGQEKDFICHPA